MRKWIFSSAVAMSSVAFFGLSLWGTQSWAHDVQLCRGIVPENNLWIGPNSKVAGGVTKAQFDSVLSKIGSIYRPIVAAKGATLVVNKYWSDGTVNAYANRSGANWSINMYGGFARYPGMSADAFALVACHEMGHHLGGAPKYRSEDQSLDWATNEGQSDYMGTLKCMRLLFDRDDNERVNQGMRVDAEVTRLCTERWTARKERAICIRSAMAGVVLARTFAKLSSTTTPAPSSPDPSRVDETQDAHPAAQCRLDTYLRGAICTVPAHQALSDSDYRQGTCWNSSLTPRGLRPRCWFKPQ